MNGESSAGGTWSTVTGLPGAIGWQGLGPRVDTPDELLQMLYRLCQHVVRSVPTMQGAGVAVQFRGPPFAAAHSSPWVRRSNECQIEQGDGPVLRALHTERAVACDWGVLLARWPALAEELRDSGVRAVQAVPVPVTHQPAGVLTLYSTGNDSMNPARERVTLVTDLLSGALTEYCAAHPREDHAIRLHRALQTRELLGQATVVLMARHRVDHQRARELLDAKASDKHVTLATAARAVLREYL